MKKMNFFKKELAVFVLIIGTSFSSMGQDKSMMEVFGENITYQTVKDVSKLVGSMFSSSDHNVMINVANDDFVKLSNVHHYTESGAYTKKRVWKNEQGNTEWGITTGIIEKINPSEGGIWYFEGQNEGVEAMVTMFCEDYNTTLFFYVHDKPSRNVWTKVMMKDGDVMYNATEAQKHNFLLELYDTSKKATGGTHYLDKGHFSITYETTPLNESTMTVIIRDRAKDTVGKDRDS